jgi:hypothetical protein
MNEFQEQVGEVLRRAQEIQDQTAHLAASNAEIEQFVVAAEESGLSRDATLQALRERLTYKPDVYKENDFVFAKSADSRYYVARVLSAKDGVARVRYSMGGEDDVSFADLKVFSMVPGRRVTYFSPGNQWWFEGEVVKVDLAAEKVTMNLWGTTETVRFDKIRLAPKSLTKSVVDFKATTTLWAVGLAAGIGGGLVGAAIALVLRR